MKDQQKASDACQLYVEVGSNRIWNLHYQHQKSSEGSSTKGASIYILSENKATPKTTKE